MNYPVKRIKSALRLIALGLGFLQAWEYRFYIEPDGVNYFDISRAYLNRDWTNALNAYWSPLYSWLLALLQWAFPVSKYWESTVLHLLNFVLLIFALAGFEYFWGRLQLIARKVFPHNTAEDDLPEWTWWILGYTVFLTCTLRFISVGSDTPDMALAAVVFFASGLLADLACSERGAPHYVLLGLVLGVGYLTKAVMFPLSIIYIASAAVARQGVKRPAAEALVTLGAFLLVSLPLALALSHVKGYFTFGETGRVAYINEVAQGNASGVTHAPSKLFDRPPVYTYVTPFTSTYSAWHDPSYWWEGARPRFNFRKQLSALARSMSAYFVLVSTEKQWIVAWLVLAILATEWRTILQRVLRLSFLWAVPLIALGLYTLILVQPRYVGAWLAILSLVLFVAVPYPRASNPARSVGVAVVLAVSITSGIAIVKNGITSVAACMRPTKHTQWQVAQGLLGMGLTPGDKVAFFGHTTVADYWAHLADLRVTADIPLEGMASYRLATAAERNQIASRLKAEGIKALVTTMPPHDGDWIQITDTDYYVEFIQENLQRSKNPRQFGDFSGSKLN